MPVFDNLNAQQLATILTSAINHTYSIRNVLLGTNEVDISKILEYAFGYDSKQNKYYNESAYVDQPYSAFLKRWQCGSIGDFVQYIKYRAGKIDAKFRYDLMEHKILAVESN